MTLKHWLSASRALGIAAAVSLPLCMLALQDIFHGEDDLRLEFWMMRIGTLAMALSIATTLVTLGKVRRVIGR